jgi:hypothetical protein
MRVMSGFHFISLQDLFDSPDEPVEWLIEDLLIKGGVSLWVSKPKVGKTTLVQTLIMDVLNGQDFLGFKTEKSNVVFLGLEGHKGELKKDLRALGATGDECLILHVGPAPIAPLEAIEELVKTEKPGLLVVDTMVKLLRIKDVNNYGEVNEKFEPLFGLARKYGTHIICLHHSKKGAKGDDDDVLGSTAILGMVDVLFMLTTKGRARVLSSTVRYGKPIESLYLEMDADTKRITTKSKQEVEIQRVVEDIVRVLNANPGVPLTEDEIQTGVKANNALFTKALRLGLELERYQRTGKGVKGEPHKYFIPVPEIQVPTLRERDGNQNDHGVGVLRNSGSNFDSPRREGPSVIDVSLATGGDE